MVRLVIDVSAVGRSAIVRLVIDVSVWGGLLWSVWL